MAILRVKELMKEKGVSREVLAERVNVSATTISNICSEKNYPTIPLLLVIADALDVDVREMFVSTKDSSIKTENVDEVILKLKQSIELLS